ncbi:unnamed protein product [Vitrella brassicaformis CCMP3155]|uniref:Uncharacterized protein n=2 Tax=Vitrella brassicaformis TaxID=1169539 RepID=A0A0G4GX55_VITBC|nr:unnamed protein product [Vitrella brassicaformis CCMP3155]|eukprot:CEM35608.1 unnamed protein product [Vitrella brassicaformis CCMP3155]
MHQNHTTSAEPRPSTGPSASAHQPSAALVEELEQAKRELVQRDFALQSITRSLQNVSRLAQDDRQEVVRLRQVLNSEGGRGNSSRPARQLPAVSKSADGTSTSPSSDKDRDNKPARAHKYHDAAVDDFHLTPPLNHTLSASLSDLLLRGMPSKAKKEEPTRPHVSLESRIKSSHIYRQLEAQNQKLTEHLRESEEQRKGLEAELAAVRARCSTAKKRATKVIAERDRLHQMWNTQKEWAERLEQGREKLEQGKRDLERQLKQHIERYSACEKAADETAAQLADERHAIIRKDMLYEDILATATRKIERLEADLTAATEETRRESAMRSTIERHSKREIDTWDAKCSQLQTTCDELQRALESLAAEKVPCRSSEAQTIDTIDTLAGDAEPALPPPVSIADGSTQTEIRELSAVRCLDSFFQCPQCSGPLDRPVTYLPCGCSICEGCFVKGLERKQGNMSDMVCEVCCGTVYRAFENPPLQRLQKEWKESSAP